MSSKRIRNVVLLGSLAAIAAFGPAVLLQAQAVKKCFAEVCSTSNGVTICVEHEVPCPSQT